MIFLASIDPGSSFLGLSIYQMSDTRKITQIDSYTIEATSEYRNTYINEKPSYTEMLSSDRIEYITVRILDILALYDTIDILVIERPFMNHQRPQSYVVLMQQVTKMLEAIEKRYPSIIMRGYSVQEVKKTFSKAGKKEKESMLEGAIENKILSRFFTKKELCDLSEHAIDSLAVGLTHIMVMNNEP